MRRRRSTFEPSDGPANDMVLAAGATSTAVIPRISDALWQELAPLIERCDPPAAVGRHRVEVRPVLEAILYRMALGCSWSRLPSFFPHTSSVYRTYRRWLEAGLLDQIIDRTIAHQTARNGDGLALPSPASATTGAQRSRMHASSAAK
jgi:transposase